MVSGRSILAPNDPRHGTANGYNNHKCRCGPCNKAWQKYLEPRRKPTREARRKRGQCQDCQAMAIANRARCAKCLRRIAQRVKEARHWRLAISEMSDDISIVAHDGQEGMSRAADAKEPAGISASPQAEKEQE